MQKPLFTENEIVLATTLPELWDALTNPEKTPHYMYGCAVISNWKPGGTIIWKGMADGVVYVKGNIVSINPQRELSFTVFDPTDSYADIPENYLTVVYTLTPKNNDQILLHVQQGDYSKVANGLKRYEDTQALGGWQSVLEDLKKVVES